MVKKPNLVGKKKLEPKFINNFTQFKSPLKQHQCNAVQPLMGSMQCTSAPLFNKISKICSRSFISFIVVYLHAKIKGLFPYLSN